MTLVQEKLEGKPALRLAASLLLGGREPPPSVPVGLAAKLRGLAVGARGAEGGGAVPAVGDEGLGVVVVPAVEGGGLDRKVAGAEVEELER